MTKVLMGQQYDTTSIVFKQARVIWLNFGLILYSPVNNFSIMPGRVFLGLTSTKQRIKCLAQGHNTVPPVRHKPAAPRS